MGTRVTKLVALVAVGLFVSGSAHSTPILVDPTTTGSDVDADIIWQNCLFCFVDAELSTGLEGAQAYLGIGDSFTFDFFDVYVGGLIGTALVNVTATLAFDAPGAASSGIGMGGFASLLFFVNAGYLYWDQPDPVDLGDGSYLGVSFENIMAGGLGHTTTVSATVHRYGSIAVSEPGVLALLGFGLLLIWFATQQRLRRPAHGAFKAPVDVKLVSHSAG